MEFISSELEIVTVSPDAEKISKLSHKNGPKTGEPKKSESKPAKKDGIKAPTKQEPAVLPQSNVTKTTTANETTVPKSTNKEEKPVIDEVKKAKSEPLPPKVDNLAVDSKVAKASDVNKKPSESANPNPAANPTVKVSVPAVKASNVVVKYPVATADTPKTENKPESKDAITKVGKFHIENPAVSVKTEVGTTPKTGNAKATPISAPNVPGKPEATTPIVGSSKKIAVGEKSKPPPKLTVPNPTGAKPVIGKSKNVSPPASKKTQSIIKPEINKPTSKLVTAEKPTPAK